jgi:lycopene cyclase domain-containing protein
VWAAAVVALAAGWQPATYLGLELGWFLPPVVLQLLVGGRILWQQRRLVAISLLPPIVYLSLTDALAIGAGVWSIDPEQTTGLLIGGVLPLEELIFFTLTNVLIVFGMVLFITLLRVPNSPKSSELSAGRGLGEH